MAEVTTAVQSYSTSFSVMEEGSLKLDYPDVKKALYHQSLNVFLGFFSSSSIEVGSHPKVVVLNIPSGTLMHDTRPEKRNRTAGNSHQ